MQTQSSKVSLSSLMLLAAWAAAPAALAESIFKCRNGEGALVYQEKPCAGEARSVSSWAAKESMPQDGESASSPMVIAQERDGHYRIAGSVNDQYLVFMVDTGASLVTLPANVAVAAGMRCQQLAVMQTGNGLTQTCTTTIRKLNFGKFTVSNVEALIAPNLNQPLLGMNVLKRFRVEQDGGQMRLSKRY